MGLDMLNEEMATDILHARRGPSPITGRAGVRAGLGEEKLTPAFLKQLEHYYQRSGTTDKKNCLDLLASIKLKNQIEPSFRRFRPKTAMPSLGGHPSSDILNPYNTTYKREYYPRKEPETMAIRPMTSQGFTNPHELSGPVEVTTYMEDFSRNEPSRSNPIRSGTSSGTRNNKPHPLQSFMVWRFPSNAKPPPDLPSFSEKQLDEKLNQIHKRLCSSTYTNDYLGIPQGFQVKGAFDVPPDRREKAPYTLDTNSRYSYQGTRQDPTLRGPVTRYACNTKKHIPAVGTIPTASVLFNKMKKNTTYDREYNEGSAEVIRQIKEDGKRREAEILKSYDKAIENERSLDLNGEPCYPSTPKTPKPFSPSRHLVPDSTAYTDFNAQPPTTPYTYSPPLHLNTP